MLIFRIAVTAAVNLMLAVREIEFMNDTLLGRCDAARVTAFDHIGKGLRKIQMHFSDEVPVLDDVDCNVVVYVSEYIEIHIDVAVYLYDVFQPILLALRVLDDRDAAVELIKPQQLIDHHTFSCLDMVEDYSCINSIYVHMFLLSQP